MTLDNQDRRDLAGSPEILDLLVRMASKDSRASLELLEPWDRRASEAAQELRASLAAQVSDLLSTSSPYFCFDGRFQVDHFPVGFLLLERTFEE